MSQAIWSQEALLDHVFDWFLLAMILHVKSQTRTLQRQEISTVGPRKALPDPGMEIIFQPLFSSREPHEERKCYTSSFADLPNLGKGHFFLAFFAEESLYTTTKEENGINPWASRIAHDSQEFSHPNGMPKANLRPLLPWIFQYKTANPI